MAGSSEPIEPTFRAASPSERFVALTVASAIVVAATALAPLRERGASDLETIMPSLVALVIVATAISAMICSNWYVATTNATYALYATAYGAASTLALAFGAIVLATLPGSGGSAVRLGTRLTLVTITFFVVALLVALLTHGELGRRMRLGEPLAGGVRRYVAGAIVAVALLVLACLAAVSALAGGSAGTGARLVALFTSVAGLAVLLTLTRVRRRIDTWLVVTFAACTGAAILAPSADRPSVGLLGMATLGLVAFGTMVVAQFRQMRSVLETLARDRRALSTSAGRDAVTGLVNRRVFDERLERLWRAGRSTGSPLALVIADLDHFKAYNDRYGHPGGDDALRLVARMLGAAVRRPADVCARIGGEEFALLLPATDAGGAFLLAETIRASFDERRIPHAAEASGHLTMSFGVASSADRNVDSARTLHECADQALYEAKRLGRNRVAANRRATSLTGRRL